MTTTAVHSLQAVHSAQDEKHLPAPSQQIGDIMLNTELLAQAMVMAEQMASAKITVPKHLQGNVGDCYAIVLQSLQWRMNPFIVAQKTHTVNGTLGYEAQLVNALVTAMAPTKDRINYEWFGDWDAYRTANRKPELEAGLGVKVFATMKGEDAPRVHALYMTEVTTRNSPLWKTKPDMQLAYLGAKQWARLHCPDVILGVYTADELQDGEPTEPRDITPRATARAEVAPYPDDNFTSNLPKWRDAIEGGRKSAEQVIATVQSQYTLTEEQQRQIRACEPIEGEAE